MILNLATAFLAASSINGAVADQTYERIIQPHISEICINHAIDEGYGNPNLNQNAVNDLSGNMFLIETGEETGFMVVDPISGLYIESTPTVESPYDFTEPRSYYYFGPWNYYYGMARAYVHCVTGELITENEALRLQSDFDEKLASFREATSDQAYQTYREENPASPVAKPLIRTEKAVYIDNYEIVRDSPHPENHDSSCGFVAASIVLNYYDKTVSEGIVAEQFKDNDGDLISTRNYSPETNLKDKLVSYNDGEKESTAFEVTKAMNKYCADYNVSGQAYSHLLAFGLKTSIKNNRPAIIFGNYPHLETPDPNDKCNHAVVAYGYDKRWWSGYCIVNYGWGETTAESSICILWWTGTTTTFSLDENHYEQTHTIRRNEYGFADSYDTDSENITTADGLTFGTSRLRCGFIHNEYLTISPRRAGFGTAFMEYQFANPVTKIEIDISYWILDERYDAPNKAELKFQYKNLTSDDWDGELDLLNMDISYDRNNQTKLPVVFPQKTKVFRLYAHFDYMYGLTDRNKGRVSIGDIIVNTYK